MSSLERTRRRQLYKRIGIRFVMTLLFLLLAIYATGPLLSLFFPFIIALLVAAVLNPLVDGLNAKLKIPRALSALILDILACSAIFSLIGWLFYVVINEAISLAEDFQSIWDYVLSSFQYLNSRLDWFLEWLPTGTEDIFENLSDSIFVWAQSISKSLMDSIFSLTTAMPFRIGNVIVSFIISIMAVYFVITDYNKLTEFVKRHTGNRFYRYYVVLKAAVKSALGGYLKAQLLLALLAFLVMFFALAIYGQTYAVLIALVLGCIDFLPIVGTAAVLVPWGIVEIIAGNFSKGIFLFILAAGFFVIRKLVEPKIVGSQTGLHPLVALASIYVGLKIFSIWGAIFGPIVVMLAMNIANTGIFHNTITDIKEVMDDIASMLKRDDDHETDKWER